MNQGAAARAAAQAKAATTTLRAGLQAATERLKKDSCVRLTGALAAAENQNTSDLIAALNGANPQLTTDFPKLPKPTATPNPNDPTLVDVTYALGWDNNGTILLNGNIFPNPANNIGTTSVSVLGAFNQFYGSSLNATELEALTILHELSHVELRPDDSNDPDATKAFNNSIIKDCINAK